jgi:flagellar biosynthesis protein FliQ
MVSGLIGLLITILIVALIAGLVVYLIRRAPMIEEPFKSWAEYLVIVIAVIIIILRALPLIGVAV